MKYIYRSIVFCLLMADWIGVSAQNRLFAEPADDTPVSAVYKSAGLAAAIDTRKLQSLPGSGNVFFLDFDGQTVTSTAWTPYNGNKPFYCQPAGLSASDELTVWKVVCEDYRPFNVNVTTDSTVFWNAAPGHRQRLVLTTTCAWASGVSTTGLGETGSFMYLADVPSFTFPPGLKSIQNLGEVTSHELGHTVYLGHDGSTSPATDYFAGYNYWAPVMGKGYNKTVTQWSKGEYDFASNTDDDLSVLNTWLGYRTDDYGNSSSTSAALTLNADFTLAIDSGIIERNTDIDFFRFTCGAGTLALQAAPADIKPNLDIKLTLYDAALVPVLTVDDGSTSGVLNASINLTVAAGTYYVAVEGAAYGSPKSGGYSKYGSLGLYALSGQVPAVSTDINLEKVEQTGCYFNRELSSLRLYNVQTQGVVQIVNSNGCVVRQLTSNETPIDLSTLAHGVYIVRFNQRVVGKFVK
jgi:hypothetical protein